MEEPFFVISVKHTMRRDPYITLWRPDDCGYCFRIEAAGKYAKDRVSDRLGYYNSGCDSVVVPCSVLEKLAVRVKPGYLDEDGAAIPNTAKTWKTIKNSFVFAPAYEVLPEYKGAPRPRH